MSTTVYYGDKIRYNNTLVQAGGASTYPIVSLGTRLGDNGFKVSNSTGFVRKVVTDTIVGGGYTTVWRTVGNGGQIYYGGGIKPNNYCRSYKVTINAKATSGTPYVYLLFDGWYRDDSCNDWYLTDRTRNFSTTSVYTEVLSANYDDQDDDWNITLWVYNGTLAIYYLNITVWYGTGWTGASGVLCNYGSPYVAPSNQTVTNTYYV